MKAAHKVRLQRYLAQSGVASRRHSEKLIVDGKVKVNGKIVSELGAQVDPERDAVEVGGRRVQPEELVYLLMNKPKGVVTTVSDPQGRPTVMGLLPRNLPGHVVPVGRLDFYTEGVLLLTNDGELAAGLLGPRRGIEKIYHAKVHGRVTQLQIDRLRRGVMVDERRTRPAKVDVLKFTGTHTWLVITITEGRQRQIHKMCDAVRLQVLKLARVAFAGVPYFGVRVGETRQLNDAEVKALRKLAGLPD